jgi:AcrR family transcriptional regulator
MITYREVPMRKSYLSRKENIILTSIEIIDELGIQGLTIREISTRQEITEAAIYKHFKSKSEIILGVLDKFSQFDNNIASVVTEQKMSSKEGLMFIAKSFGEYYENYPAVTAILFIFDTIRNEPEAAVKMRDIFNNRFDFLSKLVAQGQEHGEICKEVSGDDFSNIIIGMIESAIFRWRLNNFNFPLKERIMHSVEALLTIC